MSKAEDSIIGTEIRDYWLELGEGVLKEMEEDLDLLFGDKQ